MENLQHRRACEGLALVYMVTGGRQRGCDGMEKLKHGRAWDGLALDHKVTGGGERGWRSCSTEGPGRG